MDTDQSNVIMAEFVGKKFLPYKENSFVQKEFDTYEECVRFIEEDKREGYVPELGWKMKTGDFHKSWDWLIPVIEKIESLGYFVMINKWTSVYLVEGERQDKRTPITSIEGFSKIENTYVAALEFILWYKLQNNGKGSITGE